MTISNILGTQFLPEATSRPYFKSFVQTLYCPNDQTVTLLDYYGEKMFTIEAMKYKWGIAAEDFNKKGIYTFQNLVTLLQKAVALAFPGAVFEVLRAIRVTLNTICLSVYELFGLSHCYTFLFSLHHHLAIKLE